MSSIYYETHFMPDPSFPVIFHYNTVTDGRFEVFPHWHINIEILYVIEGSIVVTIDSEKVIGSVGDIIVINSNRLHSITSQTESASYYCLIIDHEHSQQLGFDTTNNIFEHCTTDKEIKNIYNLIINEMINKKKYHKIATVALCTTMLILLFRNVWLSQENGSHLPDQKVTFVKEAIIYISEHYKEAICIDDICQEIGISKYHFCRVFKEVTRKTVNEYILYQRINQARFLLVEKNYNVSMTAEAVGFNNISYFSKCYYNFFNVLPSKEKKRSEKNTTSVR